MESDKKGKKGKLVSGADADAEKNLDRFFVRKNIFLSESFFHASKISLEPNLIRHR